MLATVAEPQFQDFTQIITTPAPALDRLLRERFSGASWARVRRLIATGKVFVDGKAVTDARRSLLPGQTLELKMRAARTQRAGFDPSRILFADSSVVIVDKPAGIATVPYEDQEPDALSEALRDVLSRRGHTRIPPLGVVQRLDKQTSGCLVFARTVHAKRALQNQFRAHTVHRRYLALVHGQMRDQTFRTRLVQDRGDGRRGSTDDERFGRVAVTHVRNLEQFAEACLIECRLETGRTHQIRIHCAEAGHPLLGERVYAEPTSDASLRQQLHAAELGFVHPQSGKMLEFRCALPADMEATLLRLRASARASRE
jgi:23S rRNA pseudouridine1911/1915/1917 synthase